MQEPLNSLPQLLSSPTVHSLYFDQFSFKNMRRIISFCPRNARTASHCFRERIPDCLSTTCTLLSLLCFLLISRGLAAEKLRFSDHLPGGFWKVRRKEKKRSFGSCGCTCGHRQTVQVGFLASRFRELIKFETDGPHGKGCK